MYIRRLFDFVEEGGRCGAIFNLYITKGWVAVRTDRFYLRFRFPWFVRRHNGSWHFTLRMLRRDYWRFGRYQQRVFYI